MKGSLTLGIFIFFSLGLALGVFHPEVAYAQDSSVVYESVNPDQPFKYRLKRLGEKITMVRLNVFSKESIGEFTAKLVSRREREILYIVEKDKIDLLETTTSRYISLIGTIKEMLEIGSIKKEVVTENIINHSDELALARDHYPANSAQWLLVQQAKDSVDVLSATTNQ